MAIERPHFKHPFERDPVTGKVKMVEQGTDEHVMSQVGVVVACPLGARDERPDFGWPYPEFQNAPVDTDGLLAALERFVPGHGITITEAADMASFATRHIRVEVRSETETNG